MIYGLGTMLLFIRINNPTIKDWWASLLQKPASLCEGLLSVFCDLSTVVEIPMYFIGKTETQIKAIRNVELRINNEKLLVVLNF